MPIRITGMNSGLDTDRIIQELVRGQKSKVDTIKKNQTSIQWKQDAWKELNTKALKLFNGTLGKMRFSDAYAKKTSKVSSNKATVVTGENAVNGSQNLQINKLAKTGMLTGAKITQADGKAVSSNTKLSQLEGMSALTGDSSFTVNANGKETKINVNDDTTIQNVVDQLKNAGLNANFDAGNGRFFISSKTMGEAGDFSIVANNVNGFNAMNALGINVFDKADYEVLAGVEKYADGVAVPFTASYQALFDAEKARLEAAANAKINTNTDLKTALDAKMAAKLEEYRKLLKENLANTTFSSDSDIDALSDEDVMDAVKELNDNYQTALQGLKDGLAADIGALDPDAPGFEAAKLLLETTYADAVGILDDDYPGLSDFKYDDYTRAAYDADVVRQGDLADLIVQGGVELASAAADAEAKIDDDIEFATNAMGMTGNQIGQNGASRIIGEDAEILLNGAKFTNSTNVFNINGLTITANNVTDKDEIITITTEDDSEGIYNMVKDFIKEYNALINEMDRLYNAESARDYKPLTEEEKDALSDREIDDWEKKIKDSLLRRDSSLFNISNAMKTAMLEGVSVNGKNMYLNDFGIEALSYFLAPANEKNAFFIDGDPDGAHNSEKANKLKEWIANDPKAVTDFFVGLSRNLYAAMDKILLDRNSEFKSVNTIYNDKQLKKEYDNMTQAIARQELKLTALEDKYYKQFSAMEVAMAKMQSSQSAISGLLGMQMQR